MRASVLTLVRGRRQHLVNLMRGLSRQTVPPAEFVIAWMQPERHDDLPDPGCPVIHVHAAGEPMPLAAARNCAAEAARSELLVFLDVDCVPSPTVVQAYTEAASLHEGLFLGEVLYLPPRAISDDLDYVVLDQVGVPHPSKPPVPEKGVRREPDVGELWGLSFALPATRYRHIGGMDEAFVGYGGEETDFAVRLGNAGLPFYWIASARCYHQHHDVAVPPLRHLEDIVRNAELFKRRHGRWCMDYWLSQFVTIGLIEWSQNSSEIIRLRDPSANEISAADHFRDRLFT